MKRIIKLLGKIKESILKGSYSTAVDCVEQVMAGLDPDNAMKNYAVKTAKKEFIAAMLNKVLIKGRLDGDLKNCILEAGKSIEGLITPLWETPEQWEERTGMGWPQNAAVYYRLQGSLSPVWRVDDMKTIMAFDATYKGHRQMDIICATEAGPPPYDWKPEVGK
jgi:hypothetical protein